MLGRNALTLLVAVAICAAAASIFMLGRDSAQIETIIQNEEAGDAADQASSVFQRCIDSGGMFDFATGHCARR